MLTVHQKIRFQGVGGYQQCKLMGFGMVPSLLFGLSSDFIAKLEVINPKINQAKTM